MNKLIIILLLLTTSISMGTPLYLCDCVYTKHPTIKQTQYINSEKDVEKTTCLGRDMIGTAYRGELKNCEEAKKPEVDYYSLIEFAARKKFNLNYFEHLMYE